MSLPKRTEEIIGYITIFFETLALWGLIHTTKRLSLVWKDFGGDLPGPTKISAWLASQPFLLIPLFPLLLCAFLIILVAILFRKLAIKSFLLWIIVLVLAIINCFIALSV